MAAKSTGYYLMKTGRLTGWLLLILIAAYLITGFAMCGKYEVGRLLDKDSAALIHREFDLPLLYLFLVHTGVNLYFAFRRWGWIKRRASL